MQRSVAKLEMELAPGERLLWTGQPRRGLRLRSRDAFLIPFALVWIGIAGAWEYVSLVNLQKADTAGPLKIIFPLFGAPLLLMGFYLLVGRLWMEARKRSRTTYGVTDRRAIVMIDGNPPRVSSCELRSVKEIRLVDGKRGAETLEFQPSDPRNVLRFEFIPDASEVQRIARAGGVR